MCWTNLRENNQIYFGGTIVGMPSETGIQGKKLKEMLEAILNAMEDHAIYDDPVFTELYSILSKFTINSGN